MLFRNTKFAVIYQWISLFGWYVAILRKIYETVAFNAKPIKETKKKIQNKSIYR